MTHPSDLYPFHSVLLQQSMVEQANHERLWQRMAAASGYPARLTAHPYLQGAYAHFFFC